MVLFHASMEMVASVSGVVVKVVAMIQCYKRERERERLGYLFHAIPPSHQGVFKNTVFLIPLKIGKEFLEY